MDFSNPICVAVEAMQGSNRGQGRQQGGKHDALVVRSTAPIHGAAGINLAHRALDVRHYGFPC